MQRYDKQLDERVGSTDEAASAQRSNVNVDVARSANPLPPRTARESLKRSNLRHRSAAAPNAQ